MSSYCYRYLLRCFGSICNNNTKWRYYPAPTQCGTIIPHQHFILTINAHHWILPICCLSFLPLLFSGVITLIILQALWRIAWLLVCLLLCLAPPNKGRFVGIFHSAINNTQLYQWHKRIVRIPARNTNACKPRIIPITTCQLVMWLGAWRAASANAWRRTPGRG